MALTAVPGSPRARPQSQVRLTRRRAPVWSQNDPKWTFGASMMTARRAGSETSFPRVRLVRYAPAPAASS
jgi:hypothetical protein